MAWMRNSYLHGGFTIMLLFVVSQLSSNMYDGFWVIAVISAISSWYRPCNSAYLVGAAISTVCVGLISFVLIEGSAALEMFPLFSMVAATALFCGVSSARLLRYLCGRA